MTFPVGGHHDHVPFTLTLDKSANRNNISSASSGTFTNSFPNVHFSSSHNNSTANFGLPYNSEGYCHNHADVKLAQRQHDGTFKLLRKTCWKCGISKNKKTQLVRASTAPSNSGAFGVDKTASGTGGGAKLHNGVKSKSKSNGSSKNNGKNGKSDEPCHSKELLRGKTKQDGLEESLNLIKGATKSLLLRSASSNNHHNATTPVFDRNANTTISASVSLPPPPPPPKHKHSTMPKQHRKSQSMNSKFGNSNHFPANPRPKSRSRSGSRSRSRSRSLSRSRTDNNNHHNDNSSQYNGNASVYSIRSNPPPPPPRRGANRIASGRGSDDVSYATFSSYTNSHGDPPQRPRAKSRDRDKDMGRGRDGDRDRAWDRNVDDCGPPTRGRASSAPRPTRERGYDYRNERFVTSDNEGDDFSRGGMRRRRGRSRDSHDRHYDYDRNPGRFHHDSYEDGPHRYDGRRQNISRYDRHYDEHHSHPHRDQSRERMRKMWQDQRRDRAETRHLDAHPGRSNAVREGRVGRLSRSELEISHDTFMDHNSIDSRQYHHSSSHRLSGSGSGGGGRDPPLMTMSEEDMNFTGPDPPLATQSQEDSHPNTSVSRDEEHALAVIPFHDGVDNGRDRNNHTDMDTTRSSYTRSSRLLRTNNRRRKKKLRPPRRRGSSACISVSATHNASASFSNEYNASGDGYSTMGSTMSSSLSAASSITFDSRSVTSSMLKSTLSGGTSLLGDSPDSHRHRGHGHGQIVVLKGLDPEESAEALIPKQVSFPAKEPKPVVEISNMPKELGSGVEHILPPIAEEVAELQSRGRLRKGHASVDGDRSRRHRSHSGNRSVKSYSSRSRVSNTPSQSVGGGDASIYSRGQYSQVSRSGSYYSDTTTSSRDFSHQKKRRKQENQRYKGIRYGDSSYISAGDASYASSRSYTSRFSIRHDVDDDGFCIHHPDIQLFRLKPGGEDWAVVRKKCPECIREDCPAMMGGSISTTSNYDDDPRNHSASSSMSFASQNAFLPTLQTPEEIEEEEVIGRLKRRLAARAYHFPGNTWCEDWMQYMSNTHTVLGLFFHHPLHPLKMQERIVILFGSISIGLTISNITYLYFIRNGIPIQDEVFTLNSRHTDYTGIPEVVVTKLMITLWTLGSFLHTVFDLALWHMKACTLCRYGRQIDDQMARWGRVIGLFIVVVTIAAGSYAVLLRASMEYDGEDSDASEVEESIQNSELYKIDISGKRSFRFLLGYLVEFVLALFVYYPITVTILFSGILGCRGRIPILGGRPREMKKEERHQMEMNSTKILKTLNLEEGAGNEDATADANMSDPSAFDSDFDRYDADASHVGSYGGSDYFDANLISPTSYDEGFDHFDENQIL
mmetsp:Transcript_27359/g.52953  ORF Transcript_27359/g.52953 Transcript_27359/m.52953 type:complete len:1355 (+) Transcript_27359:168-4232(+)